MLSRWKWFTHYADRRKLEWTLALQTTGFGLFLGLPLESMRDAPNLVAIESVMPEYAWAWAFGGIGGALVYCLHADRGASWPAFVRAGLMLGLMAVYMAYGVTSLRAAPHLPSTFFLLSFALLCCGSGLISASRDVGREIGKRQADDD